VQSNKFVKDNNFRARRFKYLA